MIKNASQKTTTFLFPSSQLKIFSIKVLYIYIKRNSNSVKTLITNKVALRSILFHSLPSIPRNIHFQSFLEFFFSDTCFHMSNNILMLLSLNIIFLFPARQLRISASYTPLHNCPSTSLPSTQFITIFIQSSVVVYNISIYKCHSLLRNVGYYGCIFIRSLFFLELIVVSVSKIRKKILLSYN